MAYDIKKNCRELALVIVFGTEAVAIRRKRRSKYIARGNERESSAIRCREEAR